MEAVELKILRISIPYGAIKRFFELAYKLIKREFQFLMVRLKVKRGSRTCYSKKISIPYGAIKSYHLFLMLF